MTIGVASSGILSPGSTVNVGDILIAVPSKTFTFNKYAPAIHASEVIAAPSETFTFTPYVPNVLSGDVIPVPSVTFTLVSYPPTIFSDETIFAPSHQFTFTPYTPTVPNNILILPTSKTFNFISRRPRIILTTKILERAVNTPITDEVFIILITIDHPTLTQPIRVSNDPTQILPIAQVRGTISQGEEYIFFPFDFSFPSQEANASPIAQIRIDNVSREISTVINEMNSAPSFDIKVVLASAPDIVELELPDFKLRNAEWNAVGVTGDITVEYFDQEPFPAGRFNPSGFTGLFAS